MTVPRLVIGSKNPGKVAEMTDIIHRLGLADEIVTGLEWEDVPETGETLEANAILKAEAVVAATGIASLADDTGLEVTALGGRPGVHTGRYAGPDATYSDNVALLLKEMEGVEDRSARFVTVVVVAFPDGSRRSASGSVWGRIAESHRGAGGFGYDPVFEVDGFTWAEMPDDEKNQISHRALALEALGRELDV